ncbi:MAG: poly-gamma-glutamate synthase PgsB, partial [Clostridia bacterium]
KTTGTAPSIIWEDGSEEPLRRRGRGRANIAEQMKVAAIAARRGADALVLECMALEPENQWVSEHRMIRSTIGVITNVRDDHLDVMGPRLWDVARALSLTIPRRGCLVTAERALAGFLQERARAVGASVHVADVSAVADEVNEAFPYVSFKENVACALRVCELAGVPREVAISGMLAARGDPGAMRILKIARASGPYILVNAFAANDYTSTSLIWSLIGRTLTAKGVLRDSGSCLPIVVVMNNRADRIPRTQGLSRLVTQEIRPERVFLIGEAGRVARAQLVRSGMAADRVTDLTALREPETVLGSIDSLVPGGAVLYAIGNTKGMGQRLAEFFQRNGEVL